MAKYAFLAKQSGRFILEKLYPPEIILGRFACVGRDICSLRETADKRVKIINYQKARVDLFLERIGGKPFPASRLSRKHFVRQDIFNIIRHQWEQPLPKASSRVKYLLMDSFSELTDQKFVHREKGWSFACHYSDIDPTPEFQREFICEGLLDLDGLEALYEAFFDWFERTYSGRKIIYIHYPAKLDEREKYKIRSKKIQETMDKLSIKRDLLLDLRVADEFVCHHEEDLFPYHFGKVTRSKFVEEWNRLEAIAEDDNPES